MADMKTVIQAIDAATGKVKSVYKKLVDLGDGTYGEAATLTGSKVCLSTEEKPAGQQGDTLLEYNSATKESKVYKYISGDWREI